MRKLIFIFAILILGVVLLPPTSADVISLNSGGDENVVINPGAWIEDFFFGTEEVGIIPICGNSVIEGNETCDDGNTVAGDGCSATCQTEVPAEEPPTGPSGPSGPTVPVMNIVLDPDAINLNMVVNTAVDQIVTVTNLGGSSITFNISQETLDNLVLLDKSSMTLAGNASSTFNARFVAPASPGIYIGKIIVDGKEIPVALNVKTSLLLFDSNIVVLNDDYLVRQGDELETRVTLIPLGDKARLDVTLNYVIKDYTGNTYLTKSETLLVEDRVEFDRNFDTGALPLGKYVIGLELIYSNGVAPSSAHFEVIEKPPIDVLGRLILYLIILILIIAILILIVLIIRYLKKKQEETKEEEEGQA